MLGAVRRAVEATGGPNRFLLASSLSFEEAWPARLSMFPLTVRERFGLSSIWA